MGGLRTAVPRFATNGRMPLASRERIIMAEPQVPSADQDASATGSTAVGVFFAMTLVVSAAIVYVIGDRLDNPDAAILTVLVPSSVAIGITARTSGWIGVRSLLRLRGESPGSVRLLLTAAFTVPALALAAIAIGSLITDEPYDFAMPSEGLFILLPLLIVVVGEEYGWRGFALPRLQGRYSALVAALIVGVVWWVWHYPASLIKTGVPLDTPFWLFGIFVLSLSVLMTSVFNASGGSVGLMMVFTWRPTQPSYFSRCYPRTEVVSSPPSASSSASP